MIFLHSSFRTSSTFVWSRFRADSRATAYYEIFNEALENLSVERIRCTTVDSWPSKHPRGAPYFLEYLPLLDEHSRVLGFDRSMSMECFIPADGPSGAVSDAEAAYVRGLVDHAEGRGKIPVLTAVRSMGRLRGLKAAAPGIHVLIYRNLFQQWCSYTDLGLRGHAFALAHAPSVMRLSQHDPIARQISTLLPIEEASPSDHNTFYQFVLLHLYCYAHAASAADFILDINRIAADASYRRDVEALFSEQGLDVDLSEAKQSIAYSQLEFPSASDLRDFLTVAGATVIGSAPSEIGRRFAEQVLSDLLDEYDRHDFHAKAIRSALGHAVSDGAAARAEADRAAAERLVLLAERDTAQTAYIKAQHVREVVEAEYAAILSQLEAMRLEYEGALRELATTRNERNAALTKHDNSVLAHQSIEAERDAAQAEREWAEAERQAEAQNRQGAEAERDALRSEVESERRLREAVEVEREALRSMVEAERCAREASEAEARAATARREVAEAERERIEAERQAEAQARRVAEAERDAVGAERDAGRADAETHRRAREAAEADHAAERTLRLRVEQLRSIDGAAAAERDAALAALAAAEARHAELLQWSVAFHDSTARSWSWKLTRPLRWLGLGRPKRPGNPPV